MDESTSRGCNLQNQFSSFDARSNYSFIFISVKST